MGHKHTYRKKSIGWRRKKARYMANVAKWKKNNPGVPYEVYKNEHQAMLEWKKNNPGVPYEEHKKEQQAMLKEWQWLSCQTDVNKLVQRNGNELSDSIWPEDGDIFVGETPKDEKVDTKNIIKPVDVIDEEFTFDKKTVEKTEDDKKKFISTEWVIHKFLCRCCHAEGDFTSFLTETHDDSSYEDIIQTCFNIQVFSVEGYPGADALRALCGLCMARLQDAFAFSRQVKAAEERFTELFNGKCIKELEIEVKEEVPEDTDVAGAIEIEVKEEVPEDTDDVGLCANEVTYDDNEVTDELLVESDSKIKKLKTKQQTVKPKPKKKTVLKKKSVEGDSKRKIKKLKKQQKQTVKLELKKETVVIKRADIRTRFNNVYYTLVGDMYKCIKCDKMFKVHTNIIRHFEGVHMKIKTKFKCTIAHCEEIFTSKLLRMLHKLEKHNIDERHKCNACDKYFTLKRQLLDHEKSYHMLGEAIKCTMCDHVSYSKLSMRRHMIKHKKTKDFQCKYCKKAFLRKTTLNFHERIHTGDKRKTCTECGEAFVQKASLNYHMTKYHPGVKF